MKITGVLRSNIIKAQFFFFYLKKVMNCFNKTKEPSVKSTTPPGLEPGIF